MAKKTLRSFFFVNLMEWNLKLLNNVHVANITFLNIFIYQHHGQLWWNEDDDNDDDFVLFTWKQKPTLNHEMNGYKKW